MKDINKRIKRLSKRLTITLENGQHYIKQDKAWKKWAKAVDEYMGVKG